MKPKVGQVWRHKDGLQGTIAGVYGDHAEFAYEGPDTKGICLVNGHVDLGWWKCIRPIGVGSRVTMNRETHPGTVKEILEPRPHPFADIHPAWHAIVDWDMPGDPGCYELLEDLVCLDEKD